MSLGRPGSLPRTRAATRRPCRRLLHGARKQVCAWSGSGRFAAWRDCMSRWTQGTKVHAGSRGPSGRRACPEWRRPWAPAARRARSPGRGWGPPGAGGGLWGNASPAGVDHGRHLTPSKEDHNHNRRQMPKGQGAAPGTPAGKTPADIGQITTKTGKRGRERRRELIPRRHRA